MSEFKIGQKVRATEEVAQNVINGAMLFTAGIIAKEDRDVAERRVLTIVHVDGSDSPLPYPIHAMRHPEEYEGSFWNEGVNLFKPEELEAVEE